MIYISKIHNTDIEKIKIQLKKYLFIYNNKKTYIKIILRINILRQKNFEFTGKSSRFCKYLKNHLNSKNTIFVSKKEFNILNFKSMENFIKSKKIGLKYIIHVAGLSRPMSIHEKNICEYRSQHNWNCKYC